MNDTRITVLGAIITVIGWFVCHMLTLSSDKLRQKRSYQLEFIRKQMDELYGPLSFLVVESRDIYQTLTNRFRKHYIEMRDNDALSAEDCEAWLSWLRTDLLPHNERVKALVAEKIHLIEGEKFQASFMMFLAYHDLWKTNYDHLSSQGDLSQWQMALNRPHQFDRDVIMTFNNLKKRQMMLMGSMEIDGRGSLQRSEKSIGLPWIPSLFQSQPLRKPELSSTWKEISESEHFVLFYKVDDILINSLSEYIVTGFDIGEACIVISTPEHHSDLERRVKIEGWDLNDAGSRDEYIWLDANKVLPGLMVDGQPSREHFIEFVQSALARLGRRECHVRIFGELVALLWLQGNQAAALLLEEYWHDLQLTIRSFSFFCAYPMYPSGIKRLA